MKVCLFSLAIIWSGLWWCSASQPPNDEQNVASATTMACLGNEDSSDSSSEMDEETLWNMFTKVHSTSSPQPFELEDFVNLQWLGGNQATIYRAEYRKTGQTVALKQHRICSIRVMEDAVGEIESLFKVQGSPYMLKMHGFFTHTPTRSLYIVTEFVRGRNLEDLLFGLEANVPEIIMHIHFRFDLYAAQLVLMLMWCHQKGVIHGDFKLENIMFTMSGYLKLIDFGYASEIHQDSDTTRRLKRITGTPSYSAPEMIIKRVKGPASDWFALGICMFEMFTGQYLFDGSEDDNVSSEIVGGSLDRLDAGDLPQALRDVLRRFLAYDVKDRWGRDTFAQITKAWMFQRIDWTRLSGQVDEIVLYQPPHD